MSFWTKKECNETENEEEFESEKAREIKNMHDGDKQETMSLEEEEQRIASATPEKLCNDEISEECMTVIALHKRQGSFFAYACLPLAAFGFLTGCIHIFTYIKTKDWYRNSVALDLGFIHPKESETTGTSLVIDIHALLGIMVVVSMVVQLFTGIKLHRSDPSSQPEQLAMRHRLIGRVLVVVWTIVCCTGAVFTFVSMKYKKDDPNNVTRSIVMGILFWSIGIGSLINMYLGVQAVRKKTQTKREKSLNLARHKGLIFFGLFWILGAAFDEIILSVTQLIIHDCFLDRAIFAFAAAGQTVQLLVIMIGAFYYEPTVLQFLFVKINIACLALRALLIWTIVAVVVATDQMASKEAGDDSCFA